MFPRNVVPFSNYRLLQLRRLYSSFYFLIITVISITNLMCLPVQVTRSEIVPSNFPWNALHIFYTPLYIHKSLSRFGPQDLLQDAPDIYSVREKLLSPIF